MIMISEITKEKNVAILSIYEKNGCPTSIRLSTGEMITTIAGLNKSAWLDTLYEGALIECKLVTNLTESSSYTTAYNFSIYSPEKEETKVIHRKKHAAKKKKAKDLEELKALGRVE